MGGRTMAADDYGTIRRRMAELSGRAYQEVEGGDVTHTPLPPSHGNPNPLPPGGFPTTLEGLRGALKYLAREKGVDVARQVLFRRGIHNVSSTPVDQIEGAIVEALEAARPSYFSCSC